MTVHLSSRAISQAKTFQRENAQWRGKGLRLWIAGKNCEGMLYGVTFDTPGHDDHVIIQSGVPLLIDPDTARYVDGSEIDFVDDERGRGFLVNNPNASQYKGKFYLKGTA